ncbi:MAG: hypothetical protein ABI134_28855 [Byssovorax sp.]
MSDTSSRAAEQAAELRRAEREASRGPREDSSLAALLIWALSPNGETTVMSGLLLVIESQLFAVSTAEAEGQETAPWSGAALRLTHAAIEIERRERAGRAAAEQVKRDEDEDEGDQDDEGDEKEVETQEAEVVE